MNIILPEVNSDLL